MPVPTTEIVIINSNDSFPTPEPLLSTFKQIKTLGVNPSFYTGVEAENPKGGFIIVQWDSYEQHQKVVKSPSYTDVVNDLKPVLSGQNPTGTTEHKIYHVQFSGPAVAFDQPVTEMVIITLKDPGNHGAVVDILSKRSEASGNMLVYGQTREDENKYIIVSGWPTVEAQKQTASKPEVAAALRQLYSLADEDNLYSVTLTKGS
ncbi:hypothetical protein JVU11DRAFT_9048 [Chiua virens]|nr:hypothetical protein JVU11DRAFT_11661 [Chiua virens]KAG9311133.1 hypothetical protein JVU11DRAFT_9048 [Chiua virens]